RSAPTRAAKELCRRSRAGASLESEMSSSERGLRQVPSCHPERSRGLPLRKLKGNATGSLGLARDDGYRAANFVKIMLAASAKPCAIQSAELSAVLVSKPVRTRMACMP